MPKTRSSRRAAQGGGAVSSRRVAQGGGDVENETSTVPIQPGSSQEVGSPPIQRLLMSNQPGSSQGMAIAEQIEGIHVPSEVISNGLDPVLIPSVHSDITHHVCVNNKQTIASGQYVDLGCLLNGNVISQQAKHIEIGPLGELLIKPNQATKMISNISEWTDTFLIYASVFVAAHPHRFQEMFKYIHTIRTAAKRHPGLGWKVYDEQFRMRLATDPTTFSFAKVDYELWLMFIHTPLNGIYEQTKNLTRKCYDYNYRYCGKIDCQYRHNCLMCNGIHPSKFCSSSRHESQRFGTVRPWRATVSQGQPRPYQPVQRFRMAFRPRAQQ